MGNIFELFIIHIHRTWQPILFDSINSECVIQSIDQIEFNIIKKYDIKRTTHICLKWIKIVFHLNNMADLNQIDHYFFWVSEKLLKI